MTGSSKFLCANLPDLWRVANSYLPQVADAYADAAGRVSGAAASDTRAFGNPQAEHATGGPVYVGGSQVFPYWQTVRDEFHRILSETADNISDTARALDQVVEIYKKTDDAAAESLRSEVARHEYLGSLDRASLRSLDAGIGKD